MVDVTIQYVNIYVSKITRSIDFYRDIVGLELHFTDEEHGYASFNAGPIRVGLAEVSKSQDNLTGRHTGVGFCTVDLEQTYAEWVDRGVEFSMKPERQPWGGFMAMFADPDGNISYLDQPDVVHSG